MSTGPEATTVDQFLGGRLAIEQPARGFRAGLDAVLLAAAVEAPVGGALRVLDAGAGVGTAGLCVASRLAEARVTLVERAPALAKLARSNVGRNGLAERVTVIDADIVGRASDHAALGLGPAGYDVVIANPPYLQEGKHRLPADAIAAGAFGMAEGSLEAWLRFMARMCTGGGQMALIHRADALAEVLEATGERFGALRILPIQPRDGEPAHRLIVIGRKGSRAPLQLLPGLALHGPGNAFLPAVKAVLHDGEPLPSTGGRK